MEVERYKYVKKNHVFFTSESSNHQISISPCQNAGKPMTIQIFKVRGPRKFVVKRLNGVKVGSLRAKFRKFH